LGLGVGVVLDAVFPREEFRLQAGDIAARHGARFCPIHCCCSEAGLWRARMESRVQYVPRWTPVGWDEVRRLQGEYEPWDAGVALFVDAVNPFPENLERVLRRVRGSAPVSREQEGT
jgi:predicted kinase